MRRLVHDDADQCSAVRRQLRPPAGLQAQPHPVAEIVQCGEPAPNASVFNNLPIRPFGCIELPQRKLLIRAQDETLAATRQTEPPPRRSGIDVYVGTTDVERFNCDDRQLVVLKLTERSVRNVDSCARQSE
jgi:hypothetical protein